MIEDQLPQPHKSVEAINYAGQERIAIEQALAVCKQIPETDEWGNLNEDRLWAYTTTGESIARMGNFAQAYEVVQKNAPGSDQINGEMQLTETVARELAKRGDYETACKILDSLRHDYEYGSSAFSGVCAEMTKRGDGAAAVELSETIQDTAIKINAQIGIASVEGKQSALWDRIDEAVERYEDPDFPDSKNNVLSEYAVGLAAVGDIKASRRILGTIRHLHCRLDTRLAIARVEGPDSSEWQTIADGFAGPSAEWDDWLVGNDYQRQRVAVELAKAGDEAAARRLASTGTESNHLMTDFAISLAVGQLDRARDCLRLYEQMTDVNRRMVDAHCVELATAELAAGHTAQAEQDVRRIKDPYYKVSGLLAKATHAADQLDGLGLFPETLSGDFEDLPRGIPPDWVKNIGAHTLEQWRTFKDYDGATFARLAHGAAEIAHAYMTDDERLKFVRLLGDEFRRFRDQGMFDDGKHQIVLKHLSEAMVIAGDAGTTGSMLETIYATMGEATGLRLIKSLIESGNAKAGAAGIDVLASPDTPDHVYQYLLHKLAATGYIDSGLPLAILEGDAYGFPASASRKILQSVYSRLGIQLDAELLEWIAEKLYSGNAGQQADMTRDGQIPDIVSPELVAQTLDERLDKTLEQVIKSVERFAALTQSQLLRELGRDAESRALYFMLYGGRTNYALIQHYNLTKFSQAVEKAAEIQRRIDPDLIRKDLWRGAPAGWQEAMQNRVRPSESLVWQIEVGSSDSELRGHARQELRNVFGAELNWLVSGGAGAKNFSELPDAIPMLGSKVAKRLEGLLGDKIAGILTGAEQDVTMGDFEKLKNNMLSQLRQLRQTAKQQKDPAAARWTDVLEKAQAEDAVFAMRHILAVVSRDPNRSLYPNGADAEWLGHVTGLSTTIRNSQRSGKDSRTLTVRYLDGKDDFAELLRFADGAQCCFTSENTAGTEMDADGDWRMRINRDPHWFVFSIEDTSPDAAKRVSTGFVFGSVAEVDGAPALAINGIYMQRKTDAAANSILNGIVERFARPMGVRTVVVATKYGGDFAIDRSLWQPAGGHNILRPRAVNDAYGYRETDIYDDLGSKVNNAEQLDEHSWRRILTQYP